MILTKANELIQQVQAAVQLSNMNMSQVAEQLGRIQSQLTGMSQLSNLEPNEQARQTLTDMRQDLESLQATVEEAQGQAAQNYRDAIGQSKDEFESLTSSLQQQNNPTAYNYFAEYHALEQLHDLLVEISGSLMDYSNEIEQQLRQQRETPITPDKDFEADSDPAPNHFSP